MDELRQLIHDNLVDYGYLDDLYIPIELLKDEKSTPGIKLDCCKAILEGVLKTMLSKLDTAISPLQLAKYNSKDAALKLFKIISNQRDDFDQEFINNIIITVQDLSNSRNANGDISHGHIAPKDHVSPEFIDMVTQHTEATCIYLLKHFYSLDLSYQEQEQYDSDDKLEFNEYLDEANDSIGQVLYSHALYQLDYDAYIDEFDRYAA